MLGQITADLAITDIIAAIIQILLLRLYGYYCSDYYGKRKPKIR